LDQKSHLTSGGIRCCCDRRKPAITKQRMDDDSAEMHPGRSKQAA
jgi:hypothetical protein